MFHRLIMHIKRWYWTKRKYQPIGMILKRDWKVGMEGSMENTAEALLIGPFIVKGLDSDNNMIWVEFKRRHNDK
jgi:hypothetical protein